MRIFRTLVWVCATFLLASCGIKDDFPYPVVRGVITEFEVEGQCAIDGDEDYVTEIDLSKRVVTLYVNDTVDLSDIRITRITLAGTSRNTDVHYNEPVQMIPDANACHDYAHFPQTSFDTLTVTHDVRMDFTQPVEFVVRTFQDYLWTVKVCRGIKRAIEIENQIGEAIIDADFCNAVVYVKKSQRLDQLKVNTFMLGGEHGIVSPDPTAEETSDFRHAREFQVTTAWGDIATWRVAVFHTDEAMTNAWSNFAILKVPFDESRFSLYDMSIQWRSVNDSLWMEIPQDSLVIDSVECYVDTKLTGLQPSTPYEYRLCYTKGEEKILGTPISFNTEQQIALYNGDFEHWWMDGKVAYPNEQGISFWDTSNPGGASFGGSNTIETYDVVHSGSKAAMLQSQYIVIKFAAASMYTGSFGNLIGTSGALLNWGVPFESRPTALKGYMQYAPVAINRVGKNLPADAPDKGEMDQCGMYCALLSEALVVDNTDMTTFPDWETDPRVIAYGALPQAQNVHSSGQWQEVNIPLVYRNLHTRPTHLLIVFSASKYGDYFHGGEGSTLYVDDFSLEYGDNPIVKTDLAEDNE